MGPFRVPVDLFGQRSRRKCPYFWRYPNFVTTQSKEAPMPKTRSICSAISIEHELVTDTDGQTNVHSIAIASFVAR